MTMGISMRVAGFGFLCGWGSFLLGVWVHGLWEEREVILLL